MHGSDVATGTEAIHMADRLAASLSEKQSRSEQPGNSAPAGVLVLLFPDDRGRLATLLTRRTETVRDHKGQISFPGGVRDAGDLDLLATATREAHEEVGIAPGEYVVVGRLDDYRTVTGYLVRPFVAYRPSPPAVRSSPDEIAEAFFVPLARLLDPGVHELRRVETNGRSYEAHFFTLEGWVIWGATAGMISDLLGRIDRLLVSPSSV